MTSEKVLKKLVRETLGYDLGTTEIAKMTKHLKMVRDGLEKGAEIGIADEYPYVVLEKE